MANKARRVWNSKKTVWNNRQAVWEIDWELKTYWPNGWEDVSWDLTTYDTGKWNEVSETGTLEVYDSTRPTVIGTPEDGVTAVATFKNGATTLQEVTVKDGKTPAYTWETPTKEADAENTYEFDWWDPTLWPIYKNTTFQAQFKATPITEQEADQEPAE